VLSIEETKAKRNMKDLKLSQRYR